MRLPLGRTLLAGLAGVTVGIAFGYLAWRRDHDQVTLLVVGAGMLAAVVAMMLVMVLAELLARPGRWRPGARPAAPVAGAGRLARNARRYGQLTRIATRHGLASPAVGRADPALLARRLRPALEEAGPIFVKLGQVLSTRTDLLPPPVTTELAMLQDQVPARAVAADSRLAGRRTRPRSWRGVQKRRPRADGSASLAQAHAAWRADGTAVILKIQRPGIDEQVSRDLDMIRRLTRRAESRSELARAYHLADLSDRSCSRAPSHADPHPGNVLYLRSGQLGLIDFGLQPAGGSTSASRPRSSSCSQRPASATPPRCTTRSPS